MNAPIIDLNDYSFSYYDYENKNRADDFLKIAKQLTPYNHLIFATPIYWYSMSAIMKTFFDRLTDLITIEKEMGRSLKGKTISSIACSSDQEEYEGFEMPFVNTAEYLEMHFGKHLHTWIEADQIPKTVKTSLLNFVAQYNE